MPSERRRREELREIEALIARAEAELATLPPRSPGAAADPSDPARCLEFWLVALRARRGGLLDRLASAPAGRPGLLH